MVKVQNFSEQFERNIERVRESVAAEREQTPEKVPESEVVKRSLQSLAQGASAPQQTQGPSEQNQFLPSYLQTGGTVSAAKEKIMHLVNIALEGDLEKALREAEREHEFIRDALHDALVDKLLPELLRRGIVKREG